MWGFTGMRVAKRIRVIGIVQGVGFRPFIDRLAKKFGLDGYVKNIGGSEVEIYVVGNETRIYEFIEAIKEEKPPTAEIEEMIVEDAELAKIKGFKILKSSNVVKEPSMIPPDIGICRECIREILDSNSRWYYYPFNSCAWCGPRFSIMYKTPYDRENTSMKDFPLCEACKREYEDFNNVRRYHIQGISCNICGPKVFLVNRDGEVLAKNTKDVILEAARLLDEGYILSIKGIGGFHIAALATDDDVVRELRLRKKRPHKPFALMAFNVEIAEKFATIGDDERELLESKEKPIILLRKKENGFISDLVAPGLAHVGVMLPYSGLHYLILKHTRDRVLIMTSGNPKGKPMCTTNKCALEKLGNIVDYHILHNREIVNRVDDSVLRVTGGKTAFLRRSRGYAPKWLRVPWNIGDNVIVAFGADKQSAGGIHFQDKILPTQYIGDIDDVDNMGYLKRAIEFFLNTYDLWEKNIVVVTDMHPQYNSTMIGKKWSEEKGTEVVSVQHHHAHIASTMAEHKLKPGEYVIGIAIDGAGYGVDGNIWGGEILYADYRGFDRVGMLEYQPMPGGEMATIYPLRMLIGITSRFLSLSETLELFSRLGLTKAMKYGEREIEIAYKQAKAEKTIKTSSLGRVLDAFSALFGICFKRTYEGEPAMKLEAKALKSNKSIPLRNNYIEEGEITVVKTSEILGEIINLEQWDNTNALARTVHEILGESLSRIAVEKAREENVKTIVLSGGVSVNELIYGTIKKSVEKAGLKLLVPIRLPRGDGGISTGQLAVVANREF